MMNKEEYLFTITFLKCDRDGSYWSRETAEHTIKVVANTITEAIDKMKKVCEVEHYTNLRWNCEEILGGKE